MINSNTSINNNIIINNNINNNLNQLSGRRLNLHMTFFLF